MNINYKKDFKKEGSVLNIRFKVFCRDNFKCAYCGRSPNKDNNVMLVTDHIAPKSKGGSGKIDNYITSCYECNEGKKDSLLPDALLSHFKQKNIQTTKSMLLEK
jgi:5-methylcytosine-specific restriction endonuclease McrA